jgi:hypothetical protein
MDDALVDVVSDEKQNSSMVELRLVTDLDLRPVLMVSLRDEMLLEPKRLRDMESRLSILGLSRYECVGVAGQEADPVLKRKSPYLWADCA